MWKPLELTFTELLSLVTSLAVWITSTKTHTPQMYEEILRKMATLFTMYDGSGIRLRYSSCANVALDASSCANVALDGSSGCNVALGASSCGNIVLGAGSCENAASGDEAWIVRLSFSKLKILQDNPRQTSMNRLSIAYCSERNADDQYGGLRGILN